MPNEQLIDLARRATAIYDGRLRTRLESEARGQFVAIEPDSGDYFLAATLSEAMGASRKTHPDKLAYTLRIGQSAAVLLAAAPESVRCHPEVICGNF